MLELVNKTGSNSKIGYAIVLDPTDNQSFIYAPLGSTRVLGIATQSVPYRSKCKIATQGEKAQVYVSANAVKDNIIRLSKSTDRISFGASTVAKTADEPYLRIGTALNSGRGLIECILELVYVGSSGTNTLGEEFETVSKNLKSYPYDITYGVDGIDTITYYLAGGLSVVKTFNYVATVLTTIVLSGDTPSGIDLTKTLIYTGADLTSVTYS